MQIESHKNRQNKKAKRLNSIRGTQRFTKPSQTNGGANIRINSETAIPKLKNLAQEYIGVSDPYGFLTNLREALGIPNSQGASKYGVVTIPKEDGSVLEASLRITNHNSDAETYITHNANYEYNLSILVRKNFKPNTFKPHNDVVLDEFVYYGKRMQRVENPLTQIINSIIGFLQSGVYNDTTGVAFKNTSPQTNDNNKLNCNTNMNKKLIRLTESDLHKIVKESVNKILRESILSEIDLQVEPQRYGEFWLRDKNTWIEFTAEVWVDRTHLECNVYSNGDDARGEQLTNSKEFVDECLHAIINSGYEDNIEGIQEYLDMYAEKGIDYDEAIHQLESNIGRF